MTPRVRARVGSPGSFREPLLPRNRIQANVHGNERYLHSCDNWVSKETAKNLRAVAVRSGSVLLPKIGAALLGNARRIATQQTVFDNNVLAVVPESINEGYLYYLLSTLDLAQLANPGPIPSLDDSALLDQRVPCGDASEQQAIGDFLDRETARIDDLVDKKQRLVELLKEKRTALITEAVTKGLDPSVEMKPGFQVASGPSLK